jgi:teichuronic acid exporter
MTAELKKKSVSAVAWSALDVFMRQGVQFAIGVVLARLLAPEEFGIIAMLGLFIGLASAFADSGFSSALIQKKEVTDEETSSVFYFNVLAGLVMAVCLCAGSPWIAHFYQMPILKPLTCAMALNLFLGSFGSVHWALLNRELDFRTQMRISVVSGVISGIFAVVLATLGWGVWSLVAQTLISTVISTVGLWWCRPWRPRLLFRFAALWSLLRFGSYLLFSALLDTAYNRFYTLIIGKLYSARALGYYSRADSTQQLPANLIATIVGRVAFPIFSAAAGDKNLLHRGMRKAVESLMLVNLPVMLGLLAVSRVLVLTIFGEKWLPCVPYLQVLCLAGILWPLHIINLNLLKALGHTNLFFRLEIIKKLTGIITLLVTAKISILAMAWSQVLLGIGSYFLNAYYSGVYVNYPASRQLRDIFPLFVASIFMFVCVWPFTLISSLPSPALLILQVLTGGAIYFGSCAFLKFRAFTEGITELRLRLKLLSPLRA